MFSGVDVRQMRYFVALAEELHFGRAAERLHLAQPALSQQLKAMERELGLRLLERDNRTVEVTPAGAQFLAESRAVLERFEEAVAAMAKMRARQDGRLMLGVSGGLDPALLPLLLQPLSVQVEPVNVSNAEGLDALRRQALDAALLNPPSIGTGLCEVPVAHEVVGVALPSGHALARRRAVQPHELSGKPLIWMRRRAEPDLYDAVLAQLAAAGFAPGPISESPNIDTSLSLVCAGLGISLKFQREIVTKRHVGVVWRPLVGTPVVVTSSLVWRRGRPRVALAEVIAAARSLGAVAVPR
ncbi:MAG: LysR substrate-binding domain-containing protein [Chloroflexota bacterium]|nr:LysR substrate-binding domain-containing protein [Chloroflexota bacterium]